LQGAQDWCLNCGAAARTRLASPPRWRPVIVALATVVCLSLGVLAAALVALAGNGGSTAGTTRTVTAAAAPLTTQTSAGVGATATAGAGGTAAKSTTSPKSGTISTPHGTTTSTKALLERVLGKGRKGGNGARGTVTTTAKPPAIKIPKIKIKIKVPEVKLPKLNVPDTER
jgi:hypothetical protein